MSDEFRGHEPEPTEEERAWMQFDPLAVIGRALVVLVLAFAIGGYVSFALESMKPVPVASRAPLRPA